MTTTLTLVGAATPERPPVPPNRLLILGLVTGPLFIVAFLLEGWFRDGYDPMRHPVSSLALGPGGWQQTLNFLICGFLTLLFAVGLRRSLRPGPGALAGPLLVGLWGLGLIGAGLFTTDPVSGYPTAASPHTWHGTLHDVLSVAAFAGLAFAMLFFGYAYWRRRSRALAVYSVLSGVAFMVLFFVSGAGFGQDPSLVDTAGSWQRLSIGVGWLWVFLLAKRCSGMRAPRRTTR
ncbi:MAG: DUF998 domain-containing protein [Hamadaea sp.]|uniref:DUF998 domain-containing protein n=1 Tax=Hamadaea sp. TaxID=2024425 RepID=UPI0017ABE64A|nr:DUF998 domain-containing protein [Hamadaea sp.]NUR69647.1 DUF998 domain-containing protein [Hamadaea sp.]NUT19514.1 DUF998 domain-containing protein [Hamadaea sp.]